MKATLELADAKFTGEINDEASLPEALMIISGLLKAIGYSFNGELMIEDQQYLD